jgi:hypothetical protein
VVFELALGLERASSGLSALRRDRDVTTPACDEHITPLEYVVLAAS